MSDSTNASSFSVWLRDLLEGEQTITVVVRGSDQARLSLACEAMQKIAPGLTDSDCVDLLMKHALATPAVEIEMIARLSGLLEEVK